MTNVGEQWEGESSGSLLRRIQTWPGLAGSRGQDDS